MRAPCRWWPWTAPTSPSSPRAAPAAGPPSSSASTPRSRPGASRCLEHKKKLGLSIQLLVGAVQAGPQGLGCRGRMGVGVAWLQRLGSRGRQRHGCAHRTFCGRAGGRGRAGGCTADMLAPQEPKNPPLSAGCCCHMENPTSMLPLGEPRPACPSKARCGLSASSPLPPFHSMPRCSQGEDLPPPPKTAIAGPEYFGLNQPNVRPCSLLVLLAARFLTRVLLEKGSCFSYRTDPAALRPHSLPLSACWRPGTGALHGYGGRRPCSTLPFLRGTPRRTAQHKARLSLPVTPFWPSCLMPHPSHLPSPAPAPPAPATSITTDHRGDRGAGPRPQVHPVLGGQGAAAGRGRRAAPPRGGGGGQAAARAAQVSERSAPPTSNP